MKKHSLLWTILGLVIVVLLVLLIKHFYDNEKQDKMDLTLADTARHNIVQTVNVQKVQAVPLVLAESYIGFVIPIHSVEIRPFIAGFIEEVLVEGGQSVTADQTLFILEQSQYVAQMDLQMANIMSSSAEFENAKIYYERLKSAGEKAVSQSDLDAAKAKFLTAGAAVGAAVAQYDAAQVMYNYTFVNAPITGVLGNVTVTKGQYVSPEGSPLAYLVQTTPMRVVFSISNVTYLQEKLNNPKALFSDKKIRLKLADGRLYDITGAVQFLDNNVTAATSSVQVFADFDNVDRMLLPNAYVDVLVEQNIPQAITIAQNMVSMKPEGNFVWIVDNNGYLKEQKIEISEQIIDNSFYLVTSGLQAGDIVVVERPAQLDNKIPVQIKMQATQLPHTYSEQPTQNTGS